MKVHPSAVSGAVLKSVPPLAPGDHRFTTSLQLSFSRMSCKWNHTRCSLLHLAPFTFLGPTFHCLYFCSSSSGHMIYALLSWGIRKLLDAFWFLTDGKIHSEASGTPGKPLLWIFSCTLMDFVVRQIYGLNCSFSTLWLWDLEQV